MYLDIEPMMQYLVIGFLIVSLKESTKFSKMFFWLSSYLEASPSIGSNFILLGSLRISNPHMAMKKPNKAIYL